jgi:haloalkane dehalogenase
VAAAASAVDALVEHLGLDELVLVVHDLGGPVALQAASRWPERVSGLAGVNTFAWRPSGVAFRAMLAVMGSALVRGLDAVTGALPRASATRVGVGRHLDRADRRSFLRGVDRRGRRSFHRYLRSVAGHDFAAIEATVERLAGRPAITVFGARNDPLGFQPMWADRFDDLVQVTVPGGNHFPMCDAPDQVAAALTGWHRERVSPT